MARHLQDNFVRQAARDGFRSRAAYKLMEIDDRDRLFRRGMTVIDLGAAPGGWSQIAIQRVGDAGRVIAVDVLTMDALPGVEFLQGDFTDPKFLEILEQRVIDRKIDMVISDMAPNLTGQRAIDQPRAIGLAELVTDFSHDILAADGTMLVKTFQGSGYDELLGHLRKVFRKVIVRKPRASRGNSREVYLLALNHQI